MSADGSDLLRDLVKFGHTGSKDTIQALTVQLGTKETFGAVNTNTARQVNRQLFKVLSKRNENDDMRIAAWSIMFALATKNRNSNHEEFMQSIPDSQLLRCAVAACVSTIPTEAECCMKFLNSYAEKNEKRVGHLLATSGLFESILSRLDGETVTSAMDLNSASLSVLTYAVTLIRNAITTSYAALEMLLNHDLFNRVQALFSTVCAYSLPSSLLDLIPDVHRAKNCEATQYLELVCLCLQIKADLYSIIGRNSSSLNGKRHIKRHVFTHENELGSPIDEITDTTVVLYFLLDQHGSGDDNDQFLHLVRECTLQFFLHLVTEYCSLDFTRILGVTHPEDSTALSFGQKMIHFIRYPHPGCEVTAEQLANAFDGAALLYPYVRAYLQHELGGALDYCANKNCHRSSLQPRLLKQCVRCRSVSYCCRADQVAHWSEHKAFCKKRAGELMAAETELSGEPSSVAQDAEV